MEYGAIQHAKMEKHSIGDAVGLEEEILFRSVRRISSHILGLTLGSVTGIGLFAATLWLVAKGGYPVGPHLSLLGQFFPGYSVTFGGSLVGLLYGFSIGFASGWCVGFVYNSVLRLRKRKRPGT